MEDPFKYILCVTYIQPAKTLGMNNVTYIFPKVIQVAPLGQETVNIFMNI